MAVARDFLRKNGVDSVRTFNPSGPALEQSGLKFDLIVSFYAYGFHVPSSTYIDTLKAVSHEGTVMIFDVRRSKPQWLETFAAEFKAPKMISSVPKCVRLAFRV
jgi:hypothetical protein